MWLRSSFIVCVLALHVGSEWNQDDRVQFNLIRNWVPVNDDSSATEDTFLKLPKSVKSTLQGSKRQSLDFIQHGLLELEMIFKIDIVLVGFDHDGASSVEIYVNDLLQHLNALHVAFALDYVGNPHQESHDINVKIKYNVVKATNTLLKDVERVTSRRHSIDERSGLTLIPYSEVDSLIHDDHQRHRFQPALYILNPVKPQHPAYAYHHPEKKGCAGSFWISSPQSGRRYQWIDLTAGPLKYGPIDAGAGQVMDHSFPVLDFYPPKQRNKALVPDLAAMIDSAVQHLFVPGASNFSLAEWKTLKIQVVHVYDALIPDLDTTTAFESIKKQMEFLKLKFQSIEINHFHVSFGNCDQCLIAFTEALKIKTKRIPGAGMNVKETEFLDPSILNIWLSSRTFQKFLRDNRFTEIPLKASNADERIIPVFLFELTNHAELVLDDSKTAVSFPDLVIGVRSHEGSFDSAMHCNGNKIMESHDDIYRQILAAILETGWGTLPTSKRLKFGVEISPEYRWSIGNTPFDPFSTSLELSTALIAISKRNYLLSIVHGLLEEAVSIYRSFQELSSSGYISDVLPKDFVDEFYIRGNLLRSKLAVGLNHVSNDEFEAAHVLFQSSKHDVGALDKFLRRLSTYGLKPVLVCPHARGHLNFMLLGGLGCAVSLVFWILRRMKPVKAKLY